MRAGLLLVYVRGVPVSPNPSPGGCEPRPRRLTLTGVVTMFKLAMATDNGAFTFAPAGEVARILRKLADHLNPDDREDHGRLIDLNGNVVGTWTLDQEGE